MQHPFDVLALNSGALIFTPCPGTKGTTIVDALATLRQAGVSALITLMPLAELAAYHADGLDELCALQGITWFHCPIADDQAPDAAFSAAWQHAGPQVHQYLASGQTVAIHCKGGSGRTGLIAAQILYESGIIKEAVKRQIQALRPYALTLPPHVAYFNDL